MNKKLVLSVLSTALVASMATAAMAKPGAGIYVGGDVDKYYGVDAFLDNFDAALDEILDNLNDSVFVDGNANAAKLSDALSADDINTVLKPATKADFEANPYAIVGGTGSYDPTTDADLPDANVPGELLVEEASAINASQVVVKFNQKVDETTAIAAASYLKNGGAIGATPTLNEDGKSVTLTFASSQNNQSFTLKVTGVKTLDTKGTVKDFTTVVTFVDTVAPTVSKAEFAVSGDLEVTFSEPLDAAAAPIVRVKGNPVTATVSGSKVIVAASQLTNVAGGETVAIFIAGAKDLAGNEMDIYNGSATKVVDTVKPSVASVKQLSQNTVRVEFSEKLGTNALTNGELQFLKGTQIITASTAVAADATGKVFDVTFNAADIYGTPAVDTVTVTLLLAAGSVNDLAGNENVDFTQTFTFTADKTGPVLKSSAVADNKETIEITFDEDIYNASTSKIIVTDSNGVRYNVLSAGAKGTGADAKVLVVDVVAGSTAMANGTYAIQLQAGAVEDAHGNKSAAASATVVVGNATDVTKPTVSLDATSGINKFVLKFSEEVTATALDKANYKLDGNALPGNPAIYFTSTDKDEVAIELSDESINYGNSATGTNALLTVSNVTDKAGNKMDSKNLTVEVGDNTPAVLLSAALAGDQLTLTFSENLDLNSIGAAADIDSTFKVLGGTTQLTGHSVASYSVVGNKVYVAYNGGNWNTVKAASTVTVETYATPALADANELDVKGGVKVTVAK